MRYLRVNGFGADEAEAPADGPALAPIQPSTLTEQEKAAYEIWLRAREIEINERMAKWEKLAALGTTALSLVAVVAAVGTWISFDADH